MSLTKAFAEADNILTVAAKGIAEVISVTGLVNVDFNDVNTVLRNSGHAIMSSASAEGENRAVDAVQASLNSPLLNENDINGAKYVLLNITYGDMEVMMDEITSITDYIQDAAGANADVIWGHGYDPSLGNKISITLIATGFASIPYTGFEALPERKIISLGDDSKKEITSIMSSPIENEPIENMSDVLAKEPFLKGSDTIIDSQIVEEVSPSVSFEKEEEITTPVLESTVTSTVSFDLFDSEQYSDDDYSENALSEQEDSANLDLPYSDSGNDNILDAPLLFNNVSESSEASPVGSSKIESPEIVRHILEDDGETSWNTSRTQAVLSPEEQQQKTDDRNAKIHAYTNKLKRAEGITDCENEPAFVRRNIQVNLDTPSNENPISRFGLSDDDAGSGLRNNNFLHDNVD